MIELTKKLAKEIAERSYTERDYGSYDFNRGVKHAYNVMIDLIDRKTLPPEEACKLHGHVFGHENETKEWICIYCGVKEK
jgi:hypothetical protein